GRGSSSASGSSGPTSRGSDSTPGSCGRPTRRGSVSSTTRRPAIWSCSASRRPVIRSGTTSSSPRRPRCTPSSISLPGVRLLLPPSEAKRTGGDGPPLSAAPPGPLTRPRGQVQAALNKLLRGSKARAAEALLLPPAAKDTALTANRAAPQAPTLPALERYDGVLYRALDVGTLDRAGRRRADEGVVIFSGLLGMVGGGELVPDYRVPAAAMLPGLGGAGRWWRARLTP